MCIRDRSLGALPLALRLRLSQAAVNLTGARPRSFGAIERASRLRLLFARGALPEATEDVRCVLFGDQHAQAEGAPQAADMAPASHRRDRRVRECSCIASSRPEDIEEALLIILSAEGQVGVHEAPGEITLPPGAVSFGGEGAGFFRGQDSLGETLLEARRASASMTLCSTVRLAAFVQKAVVIPLLYAFARPLRRWTWCSSL